jgi:hypothetical protein
MNITVDESGVARLITETHFPGDTFHFWIGDIPSSAVTVHGINSIAVQIDTCSINNAPGCGNVDTVITKDPKAGGFITDGSSHYNWDGLIVQVAGPIDVRNAQASGSINGIPLNPTGSYIGKYNTASLEVQTGQ